MALEYVEGRNPGLHRPQGHTGTLMALRIMRQVAEALQRSEFGIIHRDIKPENILLSRRVAK
jgi:serine/threonine protein kinase